MKSLSQAAPMMSTAANPRLGFLYVVMSGIVSDSRDDLTARQLAVFLAVTLSDVPRTVRGLASDLNISKPAVTRALDRLEGLRYVVRKEDPLDRRSIHIGRTPTGAAYARHLAKMVDVTGCEQPERIAA